MKIDEITISNFRQHRNITAKFPDGQKSLVLIRGLNGTGKTNFLKALTWGLTGTLGPREPKFIPSSLVSFSAISGAKESGEVEVSVEMAVSLGLAEKARIKRSVSLSKKGGDLFPNAQRLSVLTESKSKGWDSVGDPDLWLEANLPERFSHYFLFDGEQLENFFRASESKFVQDAVLQIAQIDHLDRMVGRLGNVESDLTAAVARSSRGDSNDDLESKFQNLEVKIAELKSSITELDENLVLAEAAQIESRAQFGEIREAQGEIRRREQLETDVDKAEARMETAQTQYFTWAARLAPMVLASKAIDSLSMKIEEARQNRELPPPYDPDALRELIAESKCVCGSDLSKGSEGREHIEHLIEDFSALSERGALLQQSERPLAVLKTRTAELVESAERIIGALADAPTEFSTKSKTLEILRQKMANHDDQQIAVISQAFDLATEAVAGTRARIAVLRNQLKTEEKEKADLEKLIDAAAKKDSKLGDLRTQVRFTREVQQAATGMLARLKDEVRETVSTKLNDQFQSMIWKKEAFRPVEIDEDYRVRVTNMQGFENRSGLSAGETACLAFAFSLTLSEVAGASYPMVVDSPLGRLSGDVKESVSEVLLKSLEGADDLNSRQLIMLMTDEEFDDQVETIFARQSPAIFEIQFDQSSSEATLKKV